LKLKLKLKRKTKGLQEMLLFSNSFDQCGEANRYLL